MNEEYEYDICRNCGNEIYRASFYVDGFWAHAKTQDQYCRLFTAYPDRKKEEQEDLPLEASHD